MSDQAIRQISAKEANKLGLPDGYKEFTPFPFSGMNQQDARYAIADQEFFWLENIMREGAGTLRSVPGKKTAALYTATGGRTVLSFFFYNIGPTNYCIVFFTDGTAVQVNADTGATVNVSTVVGTFYDSAVSLQRPAVAAWGSQYILISSNNRKNDYWLWDGALLYTAGTVGPTTTIFGTGAGYGSTAPTITAFGGHGSGVTATATIDAGGVVRLVITAVGSNYQPGDYVQFRFTGGGADDAGQLTSSLVSTTVASVEVTDGGYGYNSTPTVVFTGGGGASAAATATVTGGVVTAVTMTNAGSSYESAPTISFSGGTPTKAASARAFLTPQSVASIAVTQGGTGYTLPPTVSLSGLGGTPLAAATTRLTATSISYIRVDSPGGQEQGTLSSFYEAVPNVVFYVGSGAGAGATATAAIRDGLLESVAVTAGGAGYTLPPRANFEGTTSYPLPLPITTVFLTGTSIGSVRLKSAGDGYVDAPAVIIDPGFNTAAYAAAELMPYSVSGDAIETFQSRVWLTHPKTKNSTDPPSGGTILVSAPSSLTDFSISGGGVIFSNTGSVLRSQYTALRQVNGYLYAIGDSSVDVISNVQTSGDPSITTFNAQNIDQEIGTTYRDTVQVFGRTVLFGNQSGAFGIYGGAVTRISEKLNNLFLTMVAPTTGVQPCSAAAYINNIKCYLMLATIEDPFGNAARNVMLAWTEDDWFVATQEITLTFIATQIVDSAIMAFGTDGSSIYQLFEQPSATLEKFLVTKQYGAQSFDVSKLAYNVNLHGEDLSSAASGFTASVVFNTELANATLQSANLTDPKVFTEGAADQHAYFFGATIGSTSPNFAIYNLSIGYTHETGPIGSFGGMNAPPAD